MGIWSTILDAIFPSKCSICGKSGPELCISCLGESPSAERECAKWIFPLYDYRHPPIKKAMWLLKYNGKKRISKIFAEALYGKMMEEIADLALLENFRDPILVPIPLSSKRLRERGFNQTELICEELVRLDEGKTFKMERSVLAKTSETPHQARIENRSDRLKNIIGTFSAKNIEIIAGRNIILIDDVTTTGATLSEAKKVLKGNGAKKVIAFTVAH